jgi:putative tricarboxylic transport membrane protein
MTHFLSTSHSPARRLLLQSLTNTGVLGAVIPAWAQKNKIPVLPFKRWMPSLHIVIPANTGGGWDQTGRALGAALLASDAVGEVTYENKGGKGGTIGLAHYVAKYNDSPTTLLVGGAVMVGAAAVQKSAVDMKSVTPLARLTSDYIIVVVRDDSPFKTTKDLTAALQADTSKIIITGGGAGGVDHLFSAALTKAVGANPTQINYLPTSSGPEVVKHLTVGTASVGVSSYSELRDGLSNSLGKDKLRVLGISSGRSLFGYTSFREQGLSLNIANWRGVLTGKQVKSEVQQTLLNAVQQATQHDSWKRVLLANHWNSSWLAGSELDQFIDFETLTMRAMVHTLALKG